MTDESSDGGAVEARRLTPAVWIATGFGLGLVSPAPGTAGALLEGLPLALALHYWLPSVVWQVAVIAVLFGIGVPIATAAGRALGGKKDNQAIIWDEIVTVPVVFLLVPITGWLTALLGFGLHRLFDITKPPPARQLEGLPDGAGVMADDLAAGLYAMIALYGLAMIFGRMW
ncbi:MAG TPA: phosphatidylglycerophosphatase A [Lacipirellulaceae bacterium]|jgi:phosphatidylglycerophosphatase A|nr:phosphatidylglycerophosphatase A [Lacipirellulaceae bacterium]